MFPPSASEQLPPEVNLAALTRPPQQALHPELLASWMQRTAAFSAPQPPIRGELAANGTGWLIGTGSIRRRLFPRAAAVFDRSGLLVALGPSVTYYLGHPHPVALLAAMLGLVASPMMAFGLWTRLRARRERARAHSIGIPDGVPAGTHVHLRATVCEQPTVLTPAIGAGAVLFRNRLLTVDETRGIDFWVELAGGQKIKVSARQALFLNPPATPPVPAACGPVWLSSGTTAPHRRVHLQPDPPTGAPLWRRLLRPTLRESALRPNDEVELWGILDREPAPEGEGGPGRGAPLRTVLRAGGSVHLYVKKIPG
jgi:hypothetical protein